MMPMAQRNARKTTVKSKSKSRKSHKKHTQKGKVYIAPYKIIILCAAIIALSMGLLVVSTAVNQMAYDREETFLTRQNEAEKEVKIQKNTEEKKAAEKTVKEQARKEEEKALAEKKKAEEARRKAELKQAEEKKRAEEKKLAEAKALAEKERAEKAASEKKKAEEPVRTPNTDAKLPERADSGKKTESPAPAIPSVKKSDFNFPPAKNSAQLVILLDDGGQNLNHLQKFLDLPFPLTIAVLPQLAHSRESAVKIRAGSGKELMLHQPMQAVNENVNPGPGAITPDMSEYEIKQTLFKNISEIGPVAGFNNHEGSLITADENKMEVVLKYASENGIYFLDSRTNVKTCVPAVANALGLSYYERNGRFLDNVKTRENAITEIRKNLDIANRDGVVIMIGHIWSADFLPAALMEVYPELVEKGYTFKTVSNCRGLKR